MKLLSVRASNFKNCIDDVVIDFIAKSKKTSEDKEYELHEIAEGLHVFNTAAFIGKNASGKTTAIELLDCCYSILSDFAVENKLYSYDNVALEIFFYYDEYIYKYNTLLKNSDMISSDKAFFSEQRLYRKKYFKSKVKDIYSDIGFEELTSLGELPEDTSIIFFVLKKKKTRAVYFDCNGKGKETYNLLFKTMKNYQIDEKLLSAVLKIFDENIRELKMIDDHNYELVYDNNVMKLSDKELVNLLSSGTTKGMLLYIMMVASLKNGFDLIIDEIENHFHKTLVENMISLYKDKYVNKHNAALIFTTHYCEVLDLFNRQDNIWVCRSDNKVSFDNMYEKFSVRSELMKSKQFYSNTFRTAVNYNDLMNLKKELM